MDVVMKKQPTDHYMSLDEVAQRLHDVRINRIVRGYKERRVSIIRAVLIGLVVAWAAFWMLQVPAKGSYKGGTLWIEGARLFPWALSMFVLSVLWSGFIWWRNREPAQWMEKGGAIANYIGIWVMLNQGWNIAISIITLLPLASIVIGARFGRRAFYVGMVLSLVLLGTAAPPGYWGARPAFIPFALVLLIGLPLTVVRLLSALYAVSATALEARDAQGRIIAMISHELRTPLNTICNATHIIDPDGLTPEDKQMMNTVASNANTLLYRTNQVLDLAAIDHGKLRLASEPLMVASVLQAMHAILGSRANERGVAFELHDRTGIEHPLMGDAMRIEQVLTNLASNAIKCTPAGGQVIITVDALGHPANEATLKFTVSDTGIGISDAEKKLIFQPFVQLSTGGSRQADGTGLGLYIVQGLTQALKATLSIDDRDGGGTVFTWVVTLPKAAPGVRPVGAASVIGALEAHRAQGRSLKLLVIDDHHANREVMHRLMQRAGHETTLVADGAAGLAGLQEAGVPFDAVFLDLHMPGMSGQEVLSAIRRAGDRTPVIVLSADSDPDVVNAALRDGVLAYLVKPVAPHMVLEALEAVRGVATPGGVYDEPLALVR